MLKLFGFIFMGSCLLLGCQSIQRDPNLFDHYIFKTQRSAYYKCGAFALDAFLRASQYSFNIKDIDRLTWIPQKQGTSKTMIKSALKRFDITYSELEIDDNFIAQLQKNPTLVLTLPHHKKRGHFSTLIYEDGHTYRQFSNTPYIKRININELLKNNTAIWAIQINRDATKVP